MTPPFNDNVDDDRTTMKNGQIVSDNIQINGNIGSNHHHHHHQQRHPNRINLAVVNDEDDNGDDVDGNDPNDDDDDNDENNDADQSSMIARITRSKSSPSPRSSNLRKNSKDLTLNMEQMIHNVDCKLDQLSDKIELLEKQISSLISSMTINNNGSSMATTNTTTTNASVINHRNRFHHRLPTVRFSESSERMFVHNNPRASSIISSMSSDFNGLADKTAGMLSGFFSKSNLAKVKERTQPFGPFPKGKKGLIEKSNLIRHTSAQNQQQQQQQTIDQKNQNHRYVFNCLNIRLIYSFSTFTSMQNSDNQLFLKDSINSVLEGEGIGWLKLSRLKKLMEDEQYRALVIQLLNKAMPRKIGPDDHIEDVQIPRNVWKGLLKVINAMIYGLEQNYFHHASSISSSSGMASTFAILEIAHTHFWVKEMTAEEKASMAATTATCSQRSTPFGSNENLSKLSNVEQTIGDNQTSHELQSESKDTLGSIPKSNEISWKRNLMLNQLISFESDVLSDASPSCNASDAGSLTVNPIFGTKLFGSNSFRSTCSDTDIEVIFLILLLNNLFISRILHTQGIPLLAVFRNFF